jgi:transcriptional regulator with XRE-family HTH domain
MSVDDADRIVDLTISALWTNKLNECKLLFSLLDKKGIPPMTATLIKFPIMTKKLDNPPNRIREHRVKRGLTLAELSDRTNIDAAYISKMELGDRRETVAHLRILAKHLGVTVGDLLNNEDNPTSLSETERLVIDTMRDDPHFAHSASTLAEARQSYTPPEKIVPLKRA